MSDEQARSALDEIWSRLARPINLIPAIGALLGLPNAVTRQFVGATMATSEEAEHLLDAMPRLLRSLAISTAIAPERCVGEIRGPVLWNETMSARSATAGDPGLFICAAPSRAYDTPENEVLVGALDLIRRAGHDVERSSARSLDDDNLRRARFNGTRAVRFLEHRSLASVPVRRPRPRSIQRTRSGHRRQVYQPALDLLARGDELVRLEHLLPFCDEHTASQHDVLVAVIRRLEAMGVMLPRFHSEGGTLRAGPVSYRHGRIVDASAAGDGIRVGRVVLDVPAPDADPDDARAELAARAGPDVEAVLVTRRDDITAAVERALELGID